jgi:hypothetical protein
MNQGSSTTLIATITLVSILFPISGCKKEPPTPTKKPAGRGITLRVVMFVETGADLNSPPAETGGCKLTLAQVETLVADLVAFGSSAAPGIEFNWDGTVEKLESGCLALQPFPFPPCTSVCGDLPAPGLCPRRLDIVWFVLNVLAHGAGGPAALPEGDPYISDDCTINMYFVGNFYNASGQPIAATTVPPGGAVPHYVLVNDFALEDPSAPADFTELRNRRTLIHEAVCHWLPRGDNHPVVEPGECPDNICVTGTTFEECRSEYGGKRPTKVLSTVQDTTVAATQNCGGSR